MWSTGRISRREGHLHGRRRTRHCWRQDSHLGSTGLRATQRRDLGSHCRLLPVDRERPGVVGQRLPCIPRCFPNLPQRHQSPRVVGVDRERIDEMVFGFAAISMLLTQSSQFDLWIGIRGRSLRPILQLGHRLGTFIFLD